MTDPRDEKQTYIYILPIEIYDKSLVGGWTNPSEKYVRQIGHLPQISGWKQKNFKTTTPEINYKCRYTRIKVNGTVTLYWFILALYQPTF